MMCVRLFLFMSVLFLHCTLYCTLSLFSRESRLLAGISSSPYQDNLHLARQLRWAARVLVPRDNEEVKIKKRYLQS